MRSPQPSDDEEREGASLMEGEKGGKGQESEWMDIEIDRLELGLEKERGQGDGVTIIKQA